MVCGGSELDRGGVFVYESGVCFGKSPAKNRSCVRPGGVVEIPSWRGNGPSARRHGRSEEKTEGLLRDVVLELLDGQAVR